MDAHSQKLEEALVRCLACRESGSREDLETLLAQYPDLEDELRRRLDALSALGLNPSPEDEDPFPESFGEFERLERIGGGGMGVVFKARQRSLDREVALKVIRPEFHASSRARARFRKEVESLAKLRHPGIIQILAVGEERGIPYFVMPYLRGCTVAEILAALAGRRPESLSGEEIPRIVAKRAGIPPRAKGDDDQDPTRTRGKEDWIRACLRIVLSAAKALAHAHENGLLHRDVKPSNLMCCPNGRTLLFDFGLTLEEGAERMTETGGPVGSPAYMAPEQLRQETLDARTDVYGLGVTLYEMLSLELPFLARNREELRRLVLQGRSEGLRSRNPAVPWDVETVCMVAMDPDPARRYPDMDAFAGDLERLLNRESILARRPGVLLRARRWTQRNSTLAVSLLAGILLVGGIPGALYIQQFRSNIFLRKARNLAETERNRALELEAEARRNLELALDAVDRFLLRLVDEKLSVEPRMAKASRGLVEDAIALFENYLDSTEGNPGLLLRRSGAWTSLASLQCIQGDLEAARRSAETAVADLEAGGDSGDIPERARRTARAGAFRILGLIEQRRNRFGESEAFLLRTLAELEGLSGEKEGGDDTVRFERAATLNLLGTIAKARGRLDLALRRYDEALRILESGKPEGPLSGKWRRLHSEIRVFRANILLLRGDQEKAREAAEEARTRLAAGLERDPGNPDLRYLLAYLEGTIGQIAYGSGRPNEACRAARKAVEILDTLVRDFPEHVVYRKWRATERTWLAIFLDRTGETAEAGEAFQEAERDFRELEGLETPGGSLVSRLRLARAHARHMRRVGKWDEALALLRKGVETARRADPNLAAFPKIRGELARLWNDLGIDLSRRKLWEEARRAYEESLSLKRDLVREFPDRTEYVGLLASTYNNLAKLHLLRKDLRAGKEALDRAIRLNESSLAKAGNDPTRLLSLSRALYNRAGIEVETGKPKAAIPFLERALETARRSALLLPRSRGPRSQSARVLETLVRVRLAAGDPDRAVRDAEAFVKNGPDHPATLFRAALLFARIAAHRAGDGAPETRGEGSGETRRCLELLRRSAEWARSRTDLLKVPELRPFRDLPEFRALIAPPPGKKN